MHFAMVCSDDPVNSVDDVIVEGVGEYARIVGQQVADTYTFMCPLLDVQELPDKTDENVTLDVPTLLLAGDLDISTPSFRTQLVADALPNDTFIIFRPHPRANRRLQPMRQPDYDPVRPGSDRAFRYDLREGSSPYSFILLDGSPSMEPPG